MKNFKTASRTTMNIDQSSFNSGTKSIDDNNDAQPETITPLTSISKKIIICSFFLFNIG